MMRNLMLTVAYDGADFHGWQNQPNLRTVQGCLETALRRALRHQVALIGCSRTDAGVHASGHVANVFTTSPADVRAIHRSVGSRLPKDLTLIHLDSVPLTFHATRSALLKLYRYRIHNVASRPCENQQQRFVYHFWQPLDVEAMQRASAHWLGEHDFTSFASTGNDRESNVRRIERIEILRVGFEVQIDVIGAGFLYKQVRNMVGTLVEIGRGRQPVEWAQSVLEARDRRRAGPTAPARGLCLRWVKYDLARLPEPSPELLDRAARATPPKGSLREEYERVDRSGAPMPDATDLEEEPSA